MKAFPILLILILAFAVTANAGTTTFGLKGGLTLANISGDDTDDLDSRTGFMIGGFMAIPVSPAISFQPEVFYAQKGAKFDLGGTDVTIKLDYIDIPILFKYTIAGESATPYFLFGPSIGINVTSEFSSDDASVDIGDFITSTDFGLVFGVGVNIQKFLMEVRYDLGLSNIWDIDGAPSNTNSVIGLLVGVNF